MGCKVCNRFCKIKTLKIKIKIKTLKIKIKTLKIKIKIKTLKIKIKIKTPSSWEIIFLLHHNPPFPTISWVIDQKPIRGV